MEYYCSKCKNPIKEGEEYCQKCGVKLSREKQNSQETIKPEIKDEITERASSDQKEFLEQEILKWVESNIISKSQAIKISKEYGIKYQPEVKIISSEQIPQKPIPAESIRKRQPVDVVKVISFIGAIIFGLGVIIFAATNWSKIHNIIRIIILLITTSGILYLGYYIGYKRKNYPVLGKVLIFTSALCYGGSVFLIAQIYKIPLNSHWLILIWAISIIPIAYIFSSFPVYILTSLLFISWNIEFYLDFKLPNYFYIPLFIGLSYLAYKKKSITLNIINIVGFFIWAPLFMHRLSEVLHFTGFFNWAVLIWSLCMFVFYFIYRKNIYTILSSVLFILWNITFFIDYKSFPNYFYVLPLGVMLYLSYKNKSYTNIAFNALGFIVWVNLFVETLSVTFFQEEFHFIFFLLLQILIGVFIYLIGMFHYNRESIKPYYIFFKIFGYSTIFIAINIISINTILEEFARRSFQSYFFVNILFIVLIVVLIIVNLVKGFFTSKSSKYELFFSILIILSAIFILIKPELLLANTIILNALLFILAFATILFGFEIMRPAIFNIGIAIFISFIISRFFYFWGLLPRSIFFMVGGLLLILGGIFLERKRRKTVKQMIDQNKKENNNLTI